MQPSDKRVNTSEGSKRRGREKSYTSTRVMSTIMKVDSTSQHSSIVTQLYHEVYIVL